MIVFVSRCRQAVRRIVVAGLLAAVLAGIGGYRIVWADGPLYSCQLCYEQYWDWWCVVMWGCPWPAGGGGGSGAQSVKR